MIFDASVIKTRTNGKRTRPTGGFSLIELLVVVAILAILAAIAIPAYGNYAHRARRVDGQTLLLRIADAQERFYATNNHFGSLTDIGYAEPAISEKKYYLAMSQVSAEPVGGSSQAYIATATPVGPQTNDLCGALSISNTGVKTPLPSSASANVNGACW